MTTHGDHRYRRHRIGHRASACCRWRDPPLSSADRGSARKLAAAIGSAAVVALDNRRAFEGADAVVLALRFSVLKDVIDEIADALGDTSLIVPSNPVGLDAQGKVVRLLSEGQSSGQVVARWLPIGTRFAIAFGTMSADLSSPRATGRPSPQFCSTCPRTRRKRRSRALDQNGGL